MSTGASVVCTGATDKALGAGFASTLTGTNGTNLAVQPTDSAGAVIASGTPRGWRFKSSDVSNTSVVVYITCVQ